MPIGVQKGERRRVLAMADANHPGIIDFLQRPGERMNDGKFLLLRLRAGNRERAREKDRPLKPPCGARRANGQRPAQAR